MAGGRSGGGNLVSRGYTYHTDEAGREVADGLLGVPIQVWSTKAFTANWSGYLDPGSPAVESLLYHPPGDPKALAGSFVNRLPVGELKDVLLIYGGMAYEVEKGVLTPGEYRPVLDRTTERPKWLADAAQINRVSEGGMTFDPRTGRSEQVTVASLPMWGALFHERVLPRDQGLMNASLRDLDQSWRVSDRSESVYLDQAILLANVEASGLAEPLMSAADGPSPTRLWYKALPGPGATRDAIPGTLRQETYVRVYLPVSPRPR
jgi:hypothetical protein